MALFIKHMEIEILLTDAGTFTAGVSNSSSAEGSPSSVLFLVHEPVSESAEIEAENFGGVINEASGPLGLLSSNQGLQLILGFFESRN